MSFRVLKWIPVTRKPKDVGIKILHVFWANSIDSGKCLDFAYWSKDRKKWIRFDGQASEVEHSGNGIHPSMTVTHWGDPKDLYTKHNLTNPWPKKGNLRK